MNDRAPPAEVMQLALDRIAELDREMCEIDEQITRYQALIDDPNADGWDRIDAEGKTAPLLETRNLLCRDLMLTISDATSAGNALLNGWRENEVDNVGRSLQQGDGVLARVFEEFPGTERHPVWQRLEVAACPF